jgi:hypothetical protein
MRWSKIICVLIGHDWIKLKSPPGYMEGICAPRECMHCGSKWEGLMYPPMPSCRPSKVEPEPIVVKPEIDTSSIDLAIERVEHLNEIVKQLASSANAAAVEINKLSKLKISIEEPSP